MTQTKTAKNAVTSAYAVKRSYGYDRTGNLTRSTDQRTGTTHFEYDKLGRMTKAGNERFAFDPAHNILDIPTEKVKPYPAPSDAGEGKTAAPLSDGRSAVPDNRLKTYNGTTYYYDRFGNLIHRELADGEVQNYFYDLHDQPVKAEIFKKDGSKETWAYTYDALGRRIGKGRLKTDGSLEEETGFVWDGSHLLQEVYPDGRYTYLYTDQDSYEPLAQVRNWTTEDGESRQQIHYFHCDQIGIPREMTDKDGNLVWFGDYYGWGKLKNETNVTGTAHQPFRLQNQYCDCETGLHYNLLRYYSPNLGRFIHQDPIKLHGGMNLYQFAPNISNWIDPLGLSKCEDPCTDPVNPKSSKQFGHTFTQHGAQKKNNLKGRAASTRQEQGYWTNNNDAAQFLSPYRNIDKVTTAPIPDGLGEVVLPDGSVKKANCAIIVPDKKPPKGNCLKTAYPIYSKNGC